MAEPGLPDHPGSVARDAFPDPLMSLDERRALDWLCWGLSGGNAAEHDRLYYRTDFVRVTEQHAYARMDMMQERLRQNFSVETSG